MKNEQDLCIFGRREKEERNYRFTEGFLVLLQCPTPRSKQKKMRKNRVRPVFFFLSLIVCAMLSIEVTHVTCLSQ